MNLDDMERFRQIDADNMLGYIDALPDQLADAWERAQALDCPAAFGRVDLVLICGMGGSAISGDLASALVGDSCPVPVVVNRDYDLPPCAAGNRALVIALSHSGMTEETLSAARQAVERGTHLLAITTGGELAALAGEAGGVAWTYTYPSQPRAALGWLYGLLLGAFSRLGLAPNLSADVEETVALLRKDREALGAANAVARNLAKRLAGQLVERIPVIWGAGLLAPVARRWKTQLNENAKSRAYFEVMPELNHNAVAGLSFPADLMEKTRFAIIQLASSHYDHPRVAVRHRVTHDLFLRQAIVTEIVQARGESRLAQQMNLIQFGDYVSYYVAMAYGVDPTPIPAIAVLKEELSRVE